MACVRSYSGDMLGTAKELFMNNNLQFYFNEFLFFYTLEH